MCWFEKEDVLIWVNMEGYDKRLMLRLQSYDKRHYNDFFTIERPIAPGQKPEVLFTMPFGSISGLSYSATPDGNYVICFDMVGGDDRLKNIKVEKHCFNYLSFRKMVKVHQKSGQRLGV